MKNDYIETIRLIERLHRRFLEVIKAELDKIGVRGINNIQTLILFNIGAEELTVGELTARGYYLGSNVSYNVRKLVEKGYLIQERSADDRRMTRVRLSAKGLNLTSQIDELYRRSAEELVGREVITAEQLATTNELLRALEGYWSRSIPYGR